MPFHRHPGSKLLINLVSTFLFPLFVIPNEIFNHFSKQPLTVVVPQTDKPNCILHPDKTHSTIYLHVLGDPFIYKTLFL